MFEQIEDKEKYLIQPLIEGEKVLIKISLNDNKIDIKQYNKNNKKIHILKKIENELSEYYKNSKFYSYNVVLKGFIVRNYKKIKNLILYDIMTLDEYELKTQSKRYSIRLENLNIRFLTKSSKYIKTIFSHQYNENNLNIIFEQFIKNNSINGYVFHKNIPYKFDDNEVILEKTCIEHMSSIKDFIIGTTLKQKINENDNKIESTETIPCINSIKTFLNNKEIIINLDNVLDSEKVKYFEKINEIKNYKVVFKEYNFLNKNSYIFVNFNENN